MIKDSQNTKDDTKLIDDERTRVKAHLDTIHSRVQEVKLTLAELYKPHHLHYDSVDKHQEEVKHMQSEIAKLEIPIDFINATVREKLNDLQSDLSKNNQEVQECLA